MRQLKSIFILLLALGQPLLAVAEQSSRGSNPRPPVILHKGHGNSHGNFPKAPDRQSITCTYDGSTMEFNFTVAEGTATLTLTDETPQCVTYTFDTSNLEVSVPVGTLYGTITIELDTERGNHFKGIMK